MQEESWALSSCSPASLPLPRRPAPRGGLSHPLRLRPALPRHNPWWIWCLVFVFVSVLRFFNSSSLPPSCENNSPGSSSSHQPFSAHHQLRLSLLLPLRCIRPEILSLTRLATHHSAPPGPSPVQPSRPHSFAGTTRLPATGYPSQISATLLCAALLFSQRTGRG